MTITAVGRPNGSAIEFRCPVCERTATGRGYGEVECRACETTVMVFPPDGDRRPFLKSTGRKRKHRMAKALRGARDAMNHFAECYVRAKDAGSPDAQVFWDRFEAAYQRYLKLLSRSPGPA